MKPSSTVSNALVSHGDQSEAICPPICPPMVKKITTGDANQPSNMPRTLTAGHKNEEFPKPSGSKPPGSKPSSSKPSGSKPAKEKQPVFECLVNDVTQRHHFIEEPDFEFEQEYSSDPGNFIL